MSVFPAKYSLLLFLAMELAHWIEEYRSRQWSPTPAEAWLCYRGSFKRRRQVYCQTMLAFGEEPVAGTTSCRLTAVAKKQSV
jgi:hypothetical protein